MNDNNNEGTTIEVGIIAHEYDGRDHLKAISELVNKKFRACKDANPLGYMDQSDTQFENWIIDCAKELGGRLKWEFSPGKLTFDFTGHPVPKEFQRNL